MPKAIIYTCYETGLMSKDEIKEVRSKMTPSLFAANYELKIIAAKMLCLQILNSQAILKQSTMV